MSQDSPVERYRKWTLQRIAEAEARFPTAPKQTVKPTRPQAPPGGRPSRQPRATAAAGQAKKPTGRIRARARETYVGVRRRSELRAERIALVTRLTAEGMTSPQIARQLGIAASTVRDYRADPDRGLARARQAALGVTGIVLAGKPVEAVRDTWRSGGPVRRPGAGGAAARGRQLRAIVGYYARRG